MNKNLFRRLCLMMGVFSIVFSCKTELLEDESTNPTTQNAIAKQILFKELQKQAPQIAKKVSKFSPVNISARTYTDSESDFSIDTEKSLYIEDAKGNKTYTFKMTRAENNESVLENLVLKDIGNGEFEAYIATYDSYALQNYSNLSLEDVKNHITMVYVGDRLGSEIFGKANAYTCYVMVPGYSTVYCAGLMCIEGLHDYYQPCNYKGKEGAATPGYYTTLLVYTPYDMCEGGGASAGSGDGSGVSTSPYGYNGSGGISSLNSPCEKTKQMLMGLEVSDKIEELYQQSKTNTEKGVMIQSNGSTGPLIQGNENSVQLGNITGYQSYYHNHPADQPDKKGVKIHSVNDIYKLFEFIVSQPIGTPVSDTHAGMVTSQPCGSPSACPPDGYLYINYLFTFTGTLAEAQAIKNKNYDFKALSNDYKDFEQSIRDKSEYASQYGNFMNFKGLEKVFFNALDDMEIPKNLINLQRIDKDGKVYTVTLDANGTPIETPCP